METKGTGPFAGSANYCTHLTLILRPQFDSPFSTSSLFPLLTLQLYPHDLTGNAESQQLPGSSSPARVPHIRTRLRLICGSLPCAPPPLACTTRDSPALDSTTVSQAPQDLTARLAASFPRWRIQMASTRTMARPATSQAPNRLPVAMMPTPPSTTPHRASISRDECQAIMLEMIRHSSTLPELTMRGRRRQTRCTRQMVVGIRATLDKGATILHKGAMGTRVTPSLRAHLLTCRTCRRLAHRRTVRACPVISTNTPL